MLKNDRIHLEEISAIDFHGTLVWKYCLYVQKRMYEQYFFLPLVFLWCGQAHNGCTIRAPRAFL